MSSRFQGLFPLVQLLQHFMAWDKPVFATIELICHRWEIAGVVSPLQTRSSLNFRKQGLFFFREFLTKITWMACRCSSSSAGSENAPMVAFSFCLINWELFFFFYPIHFLEKRDDSTLAWGDFKKLIRSKISLTIRQFLTYPNANSDSFAEALCF